MVNKRISVNYCAVNQGMFLVYICVETCLLVLAFGHIAADNTRPDQSTPEQTRPTDKTDCS